MVVVDFSLVEEVDKIKGDVLVQREARRDVGDGEVLRGEEAGSCGMMRGNLEG